VSLCCESSAATIVHHTQLADMGTSQPQEHDSAPMSRSTSDITYPEISAPHVSLTNVLVSCHAISVRGAAWPVLIGSNEYRHWQIGLPSQKAKKRWSPSGLRLQKAGCCFWPRNHPQATISSCQLSPYRWPAVALRYLWRGYGTNPSASAQAYFFRSGFKFGLSDVILQN
jgi:hypothetical protein